MKSGDTPSISESSRSLYEKAYSERDVIRLYSMKLDKKIQMAQSILTKKVKLEPLQELIAYRNELLEKAEGSITLSNYTDVHRLLVGAEFVVERACVPLLFGSNTKDAQRARREFADGMEARSVEIMAQILNEPEMAKGIFAHHTNTFIYESVRHFRGALQEDTVMALLNSPQDGKLIAIPSNLEEDVNQQTDLNVYYVSADKGNESYKFRLSVKSRVADAEHEKERYPHLVVVHPGHFNNQKFRVSELLVRKNEGHPGLTDDEDKEIADAILSLHTEIAKQVSEGSGESLQPRNIKSLARLALRRLTA